MLKKIITLLAFALLPFYDIFSQVSSEVIVPNKDVSVDLGVWGFVDRGGFYPASWNMVYVENNLFELRYSFDKSDALSLYYGRRFDFSIEDFGLLEFTPAFGFVSGEEGSNFGFTTHLSFTNTNNNLKLYTINQFVSGSSPGSKDVTYHWVDLSFRFNDWLNFGASEQYYQLSNEEGNFDLGPSLGIELGDFYAKTYAWDFWTDDRYLGVWWGWYFSSE